MGGGGAGGYSGNGGNAGPANGYPMGGPSAPGTNPLVSGRGRWWRWWCQSPITAAGPEAVA